MNTKTVPLTELRDAKLLIENVLWVAHNIDEEETHVKFPNTLASDTRDTLVYEYQQEGYECGFRLVERNGGASVYYFNIRWNNAY